MRVGERGSWLSGPSGVRLQLLLLVTACVPSAAQSEAPEGVIGREVAVARHLKDGEEYSLSLSALVEHGRLLFSAKWTDQEGGGRPLTKGTGAVLSDPSRPLVFPRNFNRLSGPDANSCAGCHNQPYGIPGGSGEFVTNVFVLAQRFDSLDFDTSEVGLTVGSRDEVGRLATLNESANSRATTGLFGTGYIELLAREMTVELRAIRDATEPGETRSLVAKGISFGTIRRIEDGRWDVSGVQGIPLSSVATFGSDDRPALTLKPFHQAGAVASLREFTNNALNQHHGIQSTESFGVDNDWDGDGVSNEVTRADVTALAVYQATLAVPGRVIPRQREIEEAVLAGERTFGEIGCASCHVPALPLASALFEEPGPYNPSRTLQVDDAPMLTLDLNDSRLPPPRLRDVDRTTWVPAFTDLKLHDITEGVGDPNFEPLNMQLPAGLQGFFGGNGRFVTRRLWGAGNQGPYYHHGKFTTLREAVLAHAGEAWESAGAFRSLDELGQAEIIEFLKSLQVLPPGTPHRVVDAFYAARRWPPLWASDGDSSSP